MVIFLRTYRKIVFSILFVAVVCFGVYIFKYVTREGHAYSSNYNEDVVANYLFDQEVSYGDTDRIVKNFKSDTNHAVVYGATYVENSRNGGGYSFDGQNDYMLMSTNSAQPSPLGDNISFFAWIKLSELNKEQDIINKFTLVTGIRRSGYRLYISENNTVEFYLAGYSGEYNTITVGGGTPLEADTWYLVGGSYEYRSNIKTFVNGNIDKQLASPEPYYPNTQKLKIGIGNTTGFFSGEMDQVLMYNRVFTQNELTSFYQEMINCTDTDNDGFGPTFCGGYDCDDTNSSVNPNQTELCNNIDDNCNLAVDEGFDNDNDGFTSCSSPTADCNDDDDTCAPGTLDICENGKDDDCNDIDSVCSTCIEGKVPSTGCKCGGQNYYSGYCNSSTWGKEDSSVADNLVLEYHFDQDESAGETGNVVHDFSGKENHGTVGDAVSVPGISGLAYNFDGENRFVRVPQSEDFNFEKITISAWVKVPEDRIYQGVIVSKSNKNNYGIYLSIDTAADWWIWSLNPEQIKKSVTKTEWNQKWSLVTTTYDGLEMCFYLNGTERSCIEKISPISQSNDNSYQGDDLFIGAHWQSKSEYSLGRYFHGDIDEVKIYNTNLNAEQIANDYNYHIRSCVDQDGDGHYYHNGTCQLGGDCNDNNPYINYSAEEICDNGLDENCDGVDKAGDVDGDGYVSLTCGGQDTDDTNPDVNPAEEEICNLIDDDSDGTIDEGFDQDDDGYSSCDAPVADCNDSDPDVNPGTVDICGNGADENCDTVDSECQVCDHGWIPDSGCSCGGVDYYTNHCCDGTYQELPCSDMIETFATIHNAGIRIIGVPEQVVKTELNYRVSGSETWSNGLPPVITYANNLLESSPYDSFETNMSVINNDISQTIRRVHGNVFNLEPDTDYEMEVKLLDESDVVLQTFTESVRTKKDQISYGTGRTITVRKDGSGDYSNIPQALGAASAGDIIEVGPGEYTEAIRITKSGEIDNPITLRGLEGAVLIDNGFGSYSDAKIMFSNNVHDFIIENFEIKGTTIQVTDKHDIYVFDSATRVYIQNNNFTQLENQGRFTFISTKSNSILTDFVVRDNTFHAKDLASNSYVLYFLGSKRGVVFSGNEVDVGIAWDLLVMRGRNEDTDIYNNTIHGVGQDDGIELEGGVNINIRVYNNFVDNSTSPNTSISHTPVYVGPIYVFRNEFHSPVQYIKIASNTVALGDIATAPEDRYADFGPIYYYHNTFRLSESGWGSVVHASPLLFFRFAGLMHSNFIFKNNIFYGRSFAKFFYTYAKTYSRSGSAWGQLESDYNVYWDRVTTTNPNAEYSADLHSFFEDPKLVNPYFPGQNFRLKSDSSAIDSGVVLNNINDNYIGSAPDMGKYEYADPGVNDPPVFAEIDDKTIETTKILSFNVEASDPDGDQVYIYADDLPSGSSFNSTTNLFYWTPAKNQHGVHAVKFSASDIYGNSSEKTLNITVTYTNQPPVINPSVNISAGLFPLNVQFTANATDEDGSIASYLWNFGDGSSSTSANPQHTYESAGSFTATLKVTDNLGLYSEDQVEIQVYSSIEDAGDKSLVIGYDSDNILTAPSVARDGLGIINVPYRVRSKLGSYLTDKSLSIFSMQYRIGQDEWQDLGADNTEDLNLSSKIYSTFNDSPLNFKILSKKIFANQHLPSIIFRFKIRSGADESDYGVTQALKLDNKSPEVGKVELFNDVDSGLKIVSEVTDDSDLEIIFSSNGDFSGAEWLPYQDEINLSSEQSELFGPYLPQIFAKEMFERAEAEEETTGTLFVRFRDYFGNQSGTYSAEYVISGDGTISNVRSSSGGTNTENDSNNSVAEESSDNNISLEEITNSEPRSDEDPPQIGLSEEEIQKKIAEERLTSIANVAFYVLALILLLVTLMDYLGLYLEMFKKIRDFFNKPVLLYTRWFLAGIIQIVFIIQLIDKFYYILAAYIVLYWILEAANIYEIYLYRKHHLLKYKY